MPRRRKNRTHLKGTRPQESSTANVPKSFVIKHGHVGTSLAQLTRDIRKVMEPNTATRLRERSRNKLKDFLTMAPALQVTHLLAFSLTDIAPSLRILRLSNGPTLSFRVERYSLVKDIIASSRHATHLSSIESMSAPLLVLASFPPPGPSAPPHLTLVMKTFQTLFPPLAPHKLALSSARRVVLVAYNAERGTIDWRHFRITVKPAAGASGGAGAGGSSGGGAMLDLGSEKDVADYSAATSDVSSAAEDEADVVSLAEDYVRLDEIGPRMELRLVKITEGLPGRESAVIFHEFVKKTKAEAKLRKERREEQERNVQRKTAPSTTGVTDEEEEGEESSWDEDEEISEGEVSGDDGGGGDDDEEEEEPRDEPPTKKTKLKKQA
ncbi:Brix-domain-containing protein [Lactarius deliciosus]|nr:Brix-domain-containing protein [Lactarius deliciosus]